VAAGEQVVVQRRTQPSQVHRSCWARRIPGYFFSFTCIPMSLLQELREDAPSPPRSIAPIGRSAYLDRDLL
jgi:hypothetical protein